MVTLPVDLPFSYLKIRKYNRDDFLFNELYLQQKKITIVKPGWFHQGHVGDLHGQKNNGYLPNPSCIFMWLPKPPALGILTSAITGRQSFSAVRVFPKTLQSLWGIPVSRPHSHCSASLFRQAPCCFRFPASDSRHTALLFYLARLPKF